MKVITRKPLALLTLVAACTAFGSPAGAVKSHRVNFLTGQGLRRNFSTLRRSRTSNSKDLAAQVKVSSENPAAPSSTNGRKQPADGAPEQGAIGYSGATGGYRRPVSPPCRERSGAGL